MTPFDTEKVARVRHAVSREQYGDLELDLAGDKLFAELVREEERGAAMDLQRSDRWEQQ